MNKEELLEEAKRRYPIGTKFKSVGNLMVTTATVDPWFCSNNTISVRDKFDGGIVWLSGTWSCVIKNKQYTKEDVVEFANYAIRETWNPTTIEESKTTTELFDLWVKSKK